MESKQIVHLLGMYWSIFFLILFMFIAGFKQCQYEYDLKTKCIEKTGNPTCQKETP